MTLALMDWHRRLVAARLEVARMEAALVAENIAASWVLAQMLKVQQTCERNVDRTAKGRERYYFSLTSRQAFKCAHCPACHFDPAFCLTCRTPR